MKSTLLSRRDLDFLLYEWLKVDELTKRDRFAEHSRETFDAVLDLCEQLATRYFAPHNKKSDAEEPQFDGAKVTVIPEVKEALDAFTQADLAGMTMDGELGGAQLPMTVAEAGFAWFSAANVSHDRLSDADHGQCQPDREVRNPRPDRRLRAAHAGGAVLRDHGPVRDAGGVIAGRHPDPGRTAGGRQLPPVRFEDVDLRGRTRAHRQHRQPGAGQDSRWACRYQGNLAVHRAQIPCQQRWFGRRAQQGSSLPG